jgi:anaerobic selenocysteine-containing dehydrogenase
MGEWKKTGCVLCAQNCGLQVLVEDNRMVKVRPDKDNPRSEGYACRKGLNIAFHQHNADRLTHPLKKVGDKFEQISWDQAISEIAEKLQKILDQHGPRSLAWLISGQGCHFGIPYVDQLGKRLGSKYNYTALGQEYTGRFWAHGLTLGSQSLVFTPDYKNTDMLMAVGWNPMMSHGTPQARRKLTKFTKDPNKLMVVVDPRLSETAKIADIHLALRPGTDALLFKSMIAIILKQGWHDQEYISKHVNGFDEILPWFTDFDAEAALDVCELSYEQVYDICREFTTRKSCLHDDLGILMNRHSTLVSYLLVALLAVSGRISVPGGVYFPSGMIEILPDLDPEPREPWQTQVTNIPAILGMFPPNVMPEEIMSDHPDRLRAVLIYGSNPLRSYADTTAYEKAFNHLDLLVTVEMAMSETAALSHYVLPSKSAYESWDGTFFFNNFPEVFFQMRRPVVNPEGLQLEAGEIFTRLADAMGLIPELPDSLHQVADKGCAKEFRDTLMGYIMENPENMGVVPFIVANTLGKAMDSVHLATLCAMLQARPQSFQEEAVRAGFSSGPDQGLEIFQAIIDNPEGTVVGIADPDKNFEALTTKDGRIQLHVPEFGDWIQEINPADEEAQLKTDDRFPLILIAGRHMDMNANTNMRDPAWNKDRRACTLAINPADAEKYGFSNGQRVKITTEAGEETIEVEVTKTTRKGQVIIPHGFGLVYNGRVYGANVNRLTKNTHRDTLAATPLHRYVPCRVEAM